MSSRKAGPREGGKKKTEEEDDVASLYEHYADASDTIPSRNVKKWLRQAGVMGERHGISEEEVDAAFQKVTPREDRLDRDGFHEFLRTLAEDTKIGLKELESLLGAAGKPRVTGVKDLAAKILR